ncbi:hypothetical protein GE191_00975 [Serratia fonticola]|uniref:hypothetical protein n=1 Tax=Serratia fonticola TaxID=47917 RepID=UPI001377A73E|nr:hypothetical protein [Serratia fonticola]NBJ32251.1 hypothetical protein [Serratia fonticola]
MAVSRGMSKIVGRPLPRDHDLFKNDVILSKIITQCENYIEISQDLNDCKKAIKSLESLIAIERLQTIEFESIYLPMNTTLQSYSYYIIMLYSKSFGTSRGRTSLDNKIGKVFIDREDLREIHEEILFLRNKFFAHHQLKANTHNLFFKITDGEISLEPFCFYSKVDMYSAIPWPLLYDCISRVEEFIKFEVERLCDKIYKNLTDSQREYLLSVDYEETIEFYEKSQKDLLSER